MSTQPTTAAHPFAQVPGPTLQPQGRRAPWREPVRVGVALAVVGGFFWWIGWRTHVVGEAITLTLAAAYERARTAAARRQWPRLVALGARTRIRCTCDQCARLRAEEQR